MQGGHPDAIRLPFIQSNNPDESSDGNESEVSVDEPIRLGHQADKIVLLFRETFGLLLALPVAWIQLQPTIEALRTHKRKRVADGIDNILYLQTFRTKSLDLVMQSISFCAEEEFYLIVLPLLFWNGQYELGRRLTFVVVSGLFVGNIIKDVFELPRPPCPPVWRPHNQETLDSTGLHDFGFPSTHAMNSVTNSVLIAWYFWSPGREMILSSFSVFWIFSLSISRLYVGAHTATDVRGGLGLGIIVITLYIFSHQEIDQTLASIEPIRLFFTLIVSTTVALLLCPQPRPPTPTFHQNALLAGLFCGLLIGSNLADIHGLSSDPIPNNALAIAGKVVLGFISMTISRTLVKTFTTIILEQVLGIRTKPRSEVVKKRSKAKRGKKRVIRLFTRDVDIIAIAFVKTVTYFATAFCVTYGVPYLWRQSQSLQFLSAGVKDFLNF